MIIQERYVSTAKGAWNSYATVPTLQEAKDELLSPDRIFMDGTLVRVLDEKEIILFGAVVEGQCKIVNEALAYDHPNLHELVRYRSDWESAWIHSRPIPVTLMDFALQCRVDHAVVVRALFRAARAMQWPVSNFTSLLDQFEQSKSAQFWSPDGTAEERILYGLSGVIDKKNISDNVNTCINAVCRMIDLRLPNRNYETAYLEICNQIREEITLFELIKNIATEIK